MSPKKALVLGTLLLVPVLVFLFLKMFGVNRFSLRTFYPTTVDSTMVAGRWQYDTTYHQVPAFNLTTQAGTSLSQQEVAGKILVANFFSTSCQDTCKRMNTQLLRVQDAFRLQPDVKILSISSTPAQDHAAGIQQYAQNMRANPSKWIFLTGDQNQVMHFALEGLKVISPASAVEDIPIAVQSPRLFLIDRNRHVRGIYNSLDPNEVDRLITEINVLLAENTIDNDR